MSDTTGGTFDASMGDPTVAEAVQGRVEMSLYFCILGSLLYSAFEYQKYDLKYSIRILIIESITSNTLLKYWLSTLRNTPSIEYGL